MEKAKDINEWEVSEFLELPQREWNQDIGEFDSLIIVPVDEVHDSGFRCMDFVSVEKGFPKYRLSGYSDVVHINGIGGLGHDWLKNYGTVPDKIPPVGWSIDCLKKSGLIRLFTGSYGLVAGDALSSFEIFIKQK